MKSALAGDSSIKVNEIRYVAEDSSIAGVKVAAQLTATVRRPGGIVDGVLARRARTVATVSVSGGASLGMRESGA